MGAYDIPNALIEGYDVVVNRPKSAAYRAPGTPAAAFAMETALDMLGEKLGIDPLELRLLNSAKEGTRRATGPVFQRVGFVETLQAAKDHPHYSAPLQGPYRGRGVASGFWGNGTGPSSALAIVNPDGRVNTESLAEDLEFYKQQGLITGEVKLDQLVDHSFVEGALKELGPYRK